MFGEFQIDLFWNDTISINIAFLYEVEAIIQNLPPPFPPKKKKERKWVNSAVHQQLILNIFLIKIKNNNAINNFTFHIDVSLQ